MHCAAAWPSVTMSSIKSGLMQVLHGSGHEKGLLQVQYGGLAELQSDFFQSHRNVCNLVAGGTGPFSSARPYYFVTLPNTCCVLDDFIAEPKLESKSSALPSLPFS